MANVPQTPTTRGGRNALDPRMWFAAELLGSPALQMDSALLCAASVTGEVAIEYVLELLDRASIELFDVAAERCEAQSTRLAQILTNRLGLVAEADDPNALIVDVALTARRAHPLVIVCLGSELARRAGLCSYVCESPLGWWTLIVRHGDFALVGANPGERPVLRDLRRRCPHYIARAILDRLAQTAPQPIRTRAAELAEATHGSVLGCS